MPQNNESPGSVEETDANNNTNSNIFETEVPDGANLEGELDDVMPSDTTDGNSEILEENESVEESVRKAINNERKKLQENERNQNAQGEQPGQKPSQEVKNDRRDNELTTGKPVRPAQSEELQVPARLNAEEREVWARLPKEAKPIVARMLKDHTVNESRLNTQYQNAIGEARHLVEAVRPHYLSIPALAQKGITESGFITKLLQTHKDLMSPQTSRNTLAEIAANLGHHIKFTNESGEEISDRDGNFQIEAHPKFKSLQNTVNQLQSYVGTQNAQTAAAREIQQIEQLQQAKDKNGNVLYPEASDEALILNIKPSVIDLVKSGKSYARALQIAILEHRAVNGHLNGTGQPNQAHQARPSANNQHQKRAVEAANVVRGKPAPRTVRTSTEGAPSETSMEEDVREAIRIAKLAQN